MLAPPRRRKAKETLHKEELLRRLQHYETLLKSYHAKIEEFEGRDAESPGSITTGSTTNGPVEQGLASSSQKAHLIAHGGRVKYLEQYVDYMGSDPVTDR